MYESGDVEIGTPGDSRTPSIDSRRDDGYGDGWQGDRPYIAYLEHSCNEWVIGGPEEVRLMIADLRAILERDGR